MILHASSCPHIWQSQTCRAGTLGSRRPRACPEHPYPACLASFLCLVTYMVSSRVCRSRVYNMSIKTVMRSRDMGSPHVQIRHLDQDEHLLPPRSPQINCVHASGGPAIGMICSTYNTAGRNDGVGHKHNQLARRRYLSWHVSAHALTYQMRNAVLLFARMSVQLVLIPPHRTHSTCAPPPSCSVPHSLQTRGNILIWHVYQREWNKKQTRHQHNPLTHQPRCSAPPS